MRYTKVTLQLRRGTIHCNSNRRSSSVETMVMVSFNLAKCFQKYVEFSDQKAKVHCSTPWPRKPHTQNAQ